MTAPVRPGKNCSIRDLAKYVGLSTCTVSKVLNDTERRLPLSEKTRQLVAEAARKLNYVPNVNARRLFLKRSNVIGLLVPSNLDETENTVFLDRHLALIMGGISLALQETDYDLMMLFNNQGVKQSGRYESMFRSHLLDGLIIWGIRKDDFYWNELVSMQTPTLFLTTTPDATESTTCNYITSDFDYAAYEATSQLLAMGCKRPLWLKPLAETSVAAETANGIRRAMEAHGLSAAALKTAPSDYDHPDFSLLFQRLDGCDGIISPTYNVTSLLVGLVPSLGRPLPIVCTDSAEGCVVSGIPTIVPQDRLIGRQAVASILQLIEAKGADAPPIRLKLPGEKVAFA